MAPTKQGSAILWQTLSTAKILIYSTPAFLAFSQRPALTNEINHPPLPLGEVEILSLSSKKILPSKDAAGAISCTKKST